MLHTVGFYQWAIPAHEGAAFNSFLFKRNVRNATIMYIKVTSPTVQKRSKQTWSCMRLYAKVTNPVCE